MSDPNRIELEEDQVPLEGIRDTTLDLIELFGGSVTSQSDQEIVFALPARRGLAVGGEIHCRMFWSKDSADEGTVHLSTTREAVRPRASHIAILVAGVLGAILWTLWPFFPSLGAASWVGAAIAFAAFFLTARRTSEGIAADLLGRVARLQRERAEPSS
jgi:hypothetical protein